MKKYFLFTLLFVFLVSCSHEADGQYAYKKALRVSDRAAISFDSMINELQKVDIVFVGESHDKEKDHRAELDIIKALYKRSALMGIGLEMFRADSQNILDGWINGSTGKDTFIRAYYNNWGLPWPFYRDILLYAKEKKIPLVGLNVPDRIAERVAEKGFQSLSRAELAKLPPGISCNVDPRYMDFIARAYDAHNMKKERFIFFCEAQMLWNKAMAWNLVAYMRKNPDRKMVVLAGVGHSWKRGMPEQVKEIASYTFKVVLPGVPDKTDTSSITTRDADYILLDSRSGHRQGSPE
jgi:uncharacterized iron-regulated protein